MLELEKIRILHKQIAKLGERKIAFVLEGRDASGKGGFVKLLFRYDIPFVYRHQGTPTKTRNRAWLSDYETALRNNIKIILRGFTLGKKSREIKELKSQKTGYQ